MALVYFDSSALVKLVLDEIGSDEASTLWNACDAALSSRLAYPEVCAALAAAGRNHDLTEVEVSAALMEWEAFWSAVRPIELSAEVERGAGLLAGAHQLRGADAVHLASALALDTADVVVAAWDKRLRAGAEAMGLSIAPVLL